MPRRSIRRGRQESCFESKPYFPMSGEIIGHRDSCVQQFKESCAFEHNFASLRQANHPPTEHTKIRGLPRKRALTPYCRDNEASLMALGGRRTAGEKLNCRHICAGSSDPHFSGAGRVPDRLVRSNPNAPGALYPDWFSRPLWSSQRDGKHSDTLRCRCFLARLR